MPPFAQYQYSPTNFSNLGNGYIPFSTPLARPSIFTGSQSPGGFTREGDTFSLPEPGDPNGLLPVRGGTGLSNDLLTPPAGGAEGRRDLDELLRPPAASGGAGAAGSGSRMELFNQFKLHKREGEDFYRAKNSEGVVDEDNKYYWLPDGSLFKIDKDGKEKVIYKKDGINQNRDFKAADDAELVNWGKILAKNNLLPLNGSSYYTKGGVDGTKYLLIPDGKGSIYREFGPEGNAEVLNITKKDTDPALALPSAETMEKMTFITYNNLKPRGVDERVEDGNNKNIDYKKGDWVRTTKLDDLPKTGVFRFEKIDLGDGLKDRPVLVNDPTRDNNSINENSPVPGKVYLKIDGETATPMVIIEGKKAPFYIKDGRFKAQFTDGSWKHIERRAPAWVWIDGE